MSAPTPTRCVIVQAKDGLTEGERPERVILSRWYCRNCNSIVDGALSSEDHTRTEPEERPALVFGTCACNGWRNSQTPELDTAIARLQARGLSRYP